MLKLKLSERLGRACFAAVVQAKYARGLVVSDFEGSKGCCSGQGSLLFLHCVNCSLLRYMSESVGSVQFQRYVGDSDPEGVRASAWQFTAGGRIWIMYRGWVIGRVSIRLMRSCEVADYGSGMNTGK